ncbi:MAG: rhodanese-like domain-containing protein [Bacteroidetes bacterium]|nr:MAG: rhodanese-like domain-containing protein [Bacteroidota bacterium]
MFLFSLVSHAQEQQPALKEISPIRAKLMVRNNDALMVDVREKDEVAALAYDVENIINLPLSELPDRMSELPKDKTLIMACRSGNRSRKAAELLLQNGYTNVINMAGGIKEWQAKGLAVIKDGAAAPKKACCANPNSKKCNPDGTCKAGAKGEKSCCKKGAKAGKSCCAKKGEQ